MTYVGKKPADIIATAVDTTTGTFSGDLTVDTNTLYVDSANNRVGVGTVSPSNVLHVHQTDATSNSYVHITQADGGSGGTDGLSIGIEDGGVNAVIRNRENGYLRMYTNNAERMRINSNGNVSIGATTSFEKLRVAGTIKIAPENQTGILAFGGISTGDLAIGVFRGAPNSTSAGNSLNLAGYDNITFSVSNNLIGSQTERMRIDGSGNVGIGTVPATKFHVKTGTNQNFNVFGPGVFSNGVTLASTTDGFGAYVEMEQRATQFAWHNGTTERMRIDSSGNLLVGKTATNISVAGVELRSTGEIVAVRNNNVFDINRTGTDGSIMQFRKDGSTVGSIGVSGGNPFFTNASTRGISLGSNVVPCDSSGTKADNVSDLGIATGRFKDLYLSGGVYLGGTGSANQLDDYEEGTWTPAVGGTATYTITAGRYVKVGKFITAWFDIRVSSIGTGSTTTISGVPFTSQTNASIQGMGAVIGYFNSLATSVVNVHGRIDNNSVLMSLTGVTSAVTGSIQTTTILGNGSRVTGSLIYETV